MKRRILLVVSILLILIGIFLLIRVAAATIAPKGKGALQITSNIKAQVFIDNKPLGETPLCRCDQKDTIKQGEYEIKIAPDDKKFQPFVSRIKINPGVLTAIERIFLPGSGASASVLTLEKTSGTDPQLFIATIPEGALVSVDGESKGVTPLNLKNLTSSEHELEIQKQAFSKKTIRVRAVPSYKLILNILLGTETGPDETQDEAITPTITPAPPTLSPSKILVEILNTPNGFLRVRESPSTQTPEINRVKTGETYPFIEENDGWLKIELGDGTKGWVSKTYAKKIEE
ncbi:MAG: Cell wall hydrolyses involved in spore germination [Candidatus Levybacteria bacterium GW2011_GWB1_39_7]|nr:MAG: Cell wall hydrolyses involved in spore germination [Candidatus Levybacteria bacterium GW2011_GWB1_39_7]KKR48501.1 MAG: Cell wall hydrolyses involved in spore germination [Candidatus Levybacteria bacterium GW2011_GWA2_40_16]OGH15053.1 MAG: hypothetical protein A2689_01845 [Candidatus Levybacteria bacterium RIFCSPHIGHO2_01_FULL_38_96]OGH48601.1 MAG: hypothetical protein A3G66_02795 [Candidatus Levybacteria bacterium RIFCSPLOWO2_12_FULL_39_17]